MFTWRELLDMGLRQRSYWLKQADAIKRQRISVIARAVGIAMADTYDKQRALDELELGETAEESQAKRSKATWDMLKFIGGGTGV